MTSRDKTFERVVSRSATLILRCIWAKPYVAITPIDLTLVLLQLSNVPCFLGRIWVYSPDNASWRCLPAHVPQPAARHPARHYPIHPPRRATRPPSRPQVPRRLNSADPSVGEAGRDRRRNLLTRLQQYVRTYTLLDALTQNAKKILCSHVSEIVGVAGASSLKTYNHTHIAKSP